MGRLLVSYLGRWALFILLVLCVHHSREIKSGKALEVKNYVGNPVDNFEFTFNLMKHCNIRIMAFWYLLTVQGPSKDVLIPFNGRRKGHRDEYGMKLERQRYDGWYNNMAHPEWGAVGNYAYRKYRF